MNQVITNTRIQVAIDYKSSLSNKTGGNVPTSGKYTTLSSNIPVIDKIVRVKYKKTNVIMVNQSENGIIPIPQSVIAQNNSISIKIK